MKMNSVSFILCLSLSKRSVLLVEKINCPFVCENDTIILAENSLLATVMIVRLLWLFLVCIFYPVKTSPIFFIFCSKVICGSIFEAVELLFSARTFHLLIFSSKTEYLETFSSFDLINGVVLIFTEPK